MKWYHKECYGCRKEKREEEFSLKRSSKDGLYPYCKECMSDKNRETYLKNREKFIEKAKRWQENNRHKHVLSARYHARRKRAEREIN